MLKLAIFYHKYQLVCLFSDTYPENASIMLIGQIQTHFYINHNSITLFHDFCQKIKLLFENPE